MLIKSAYCFLIGENFAPDELEKESELKFRNKEKKGDIGQIGKYKATRVPVGSASLMVNDEDDPLETLLTILANNYAQIIKASVEDIFLTLNLEYADQCNWDFPQNQLSELVRMKIKFSISCYKKDFQAGEGM